MRVTQKTIPDNVVSGISYTPGSGIRQRFRQQAARNRQRIEGMPGASPSVMERPSAIRWQFRCQIVKRPGFAHNRGPIHQHASAIDQREILGIVIEITRHNDGRSRVRGKGSIQGVAQRLRLAHPQGPVVCPSGFDRLPG